VSHLSNTFQIDGEEVDILRDYLPEWSDCLDFTETLSCYDDPRTDLFTGDAIQWFIDNFGSDLDAKNSTMEPFDVM
jgi:hypothetical protein